jgi:hypothetical protein
MSTIGTEILKQIEELTEKTNNNDYLLKAKLQERER